MADKILFTGTTHVKGGAEGYARSSDGFVDLQLAQPHPAAEQLFAAAWSACFIGAIEFIAGQRKIALPASPEIDATIDLLSRPDGLVLRARLDVQVPDLDADVARELVDAAHAFCPYSKATRCNIDVEVNLV